MNAVFGVIFIAGLAATIITMVRREIEDPFLHRALTLMISALVITVCVCFTITSYQATEYLAEQTVPFQQIYFELPFYFFLVVIASVLFSWQEAYEMYVLQCKEEDEDLDTEDILPHS